MAGCCFGKGIDFLLKRHPTQLYEAFFLLIFFFIVKNKIKFENRLISYLLIYPIFRFLNEFLRGDNRGSIGIDFLSFLTPAQTISIFLFLLGLFFYFKNRSDLRFKEKLI